MNDDTISRAEMLSAINANVGILYDSPTLVASLKQMVEELPSAQSGWIPVTERLPENEQDIFVTVEVRPFGRKPFRKVVRAFYTDGKHTDEDSIYSWNDFPDAQYDDKDNLIIPEGWWESSDYSEQQGMIDDFVMSWIPMLQPWEGGQE